MTSATAVEVRRSRRLKLITSISYDAPVHQCSYDTPVHRRMDDQLGLSAYVPMQSVDISGCLLAESFPVSSGATPIVECFCFERLT
jgi:hypothetical protein